MARKTPKKEKKMREEKNAKKTSSRTKPAVVVAGAEGDKAELKATLDAEQKLNRVLRAFPIPSFDPKDVLKGNYAGINQATELLKFEVRKFVSHYRRVVIGQAESGFKRDIVFHGRGVVVQSIRDQLWTDPMTGDLYKRYPLALNKHSPGAKLFNGVPFGDDEYATVFSFPVPEGVELQFIPNLGPHYLTGSAQASVVESHGRRSEPLMVDYPCALIGTDAHSFIFRGVIWSGTISDLNGSEKMRANGFPLVYNGSDEVRLIGGDRLFFKVLVPNGGPPVDATLFNLALRMYQLVRVRLSPGPLPLPPGLEKAVIEAAEARQEFDRQQAILATAAAEIEHPEKRPASKPVEVKI